MKTSILCIIFLLGSSVASAETLYRWFEPDGTITFSPEPPPKGIKYKKVESGALASKNENVQMLAKMAEQAQAEPAPQTGLTTPALAVQNRDNATIVQAPAVPKIQYAPETGKPFTRDQNNTVVSSAAPTVPATVVSQKSTTKSSHCSDLSKRVISLERRMRAGLSADDMDNTVVAMAHYQRSYDQHCQ